MKTPLGLFDPHVKHAIIVLSWIFFTEPGNQDAVLDSKTSWKEIVPREKGCQWKSFGQGDNPEKGAGPNQAPLYDEQG
jgi:hypothetical protein